MKRYNELDDVCEVCGRTTFTGNLYIDLFNSSWRAICPTCFDVLYYANAKKYYSMMKEILPILSEKEYDKVKSDHIVIVNAFPYIITGDWSVSIVSELEQKSSDLFIGSEKIQRKFEVVNAQSKSSFKTDPLGREALIVAIRAWVKFKSWLEYMEHEAYMFMRKECDNMIIH